LSITSGTTPVPDDLMKTPRSGASHGVSGRGRPVRPRRLGWTIAAILLFSPALAAVAQTKPGTAAPKAGPTAAQAAEAAERKKLEGVWVGRVLNAGGRDKSGSGALVWFSEFVIKDGRITARDAKGVGMGSGTYKLNLGTNPKTLDAVGIAGRNAGRTYLGIYKLGGDTLEWCAANPGIKRPTAFFTRNQVQFHMVLKRKRT
jgi:uncharacterized protein (TIGR03067 family)